MTISTLPNAQTPASETAPAYRPLQSLLSEPHTAASLAACLAVCHHPAPSRASFQATDEHGATLVTWCACCGASAHTALGVAPGASDWIRTTLAQLVAPEQLDAVQALAVGLRELEHSVETLGLAEPIERCASTLASISDAVRTLASSPVLSGASRLAVASARLGDPEHASNSVGW
jgi:hypothetical protein